MRGRSQSLKVNYRTSHQIRVAADRLLPAALVDLDGIEEGRRGTVSVFDGPEPTVFLAKDEAAEIAQVADFLRVCCDAGMAPADLAILVRSAAQAPRARKATAAAGLSHDDPGGLAIVAMHDAKGPEFRAVAVMACDDDVIPDGERIAAIGDMAELEAVYESERHLLYVACTRPRDRQLVSAVAPGSEFLEDFGARPRQRISSPDMAMQPDALLARTDVEEALSEAYVHAVAAVAGYTVSKANFDRDGVDVTFAAGGAMRPKIDAQLKATINLGKAREGAFSYPCPRRNYDLLRDACQTPRLLIVLSLPTQPGAWLTVAPTRLVMKRCAYWISLRGMQETTNTATVTISLPQENLFDVKALTSLMDRSRQGTIL